MSDKKTLDAVIEAAFEAGVAFGAGYPAREAIPEGVAEDAYRRWRDRWTGLPHEGHDEPLRDRPQPLCTAGNELRHHDRPCAVGCNYPAPPSGQITHGA